MHFTLHAPHAMLYAGLGLHLDSLRRRQPDQLAEGPTFIGNNIIHPTAKIGSDCQIGPDVSVGLECEIGNGVRISNSVLLHRVKVCNLAVTLQCLLANRCQCIPYA